MRDIKSNATRWTKRKSRKRFYENYECYETLILVTAEASENLSQSPAWISK